tara:strand:+ start:4388 stop:4861 length:474 start_codon:yes stop_codon:yes gene_type:complete
MSTGGIQAPNRELSQRDSATSKFNHNLSLLIFQLSKIYPEDHDLKVWAEKFEWSKRFNAKLVCELFVDILGNYIEKIMTKDEKFFLMEIDYHGKIENKEYLYLINKVIHVWSDSINEKLKDNIWKYFQTLLTYGIIACKRQDLADQLNKYRSTPLKV